MSLQHVLRPESVANRFGYHTTEKDAGNMLESKLQQEFAICNQLSSVGEKEGSHERLVYLTSCLIGHTVEVQVLDGSVFSGIFHATDVEKDFGIILKMAHLTKDVSGGQKNFSDSIVKQPLKTMIIPAKDLVQVIVKGVPVTRSGWTSDLQCESSEILIDSCISQSQHVNVGRALEHWVPGDDEPECPELEDIFDGQWNRGWDQFEVNETLFGVKSTFDEELYTTKLEKGPQMKDLEREALRIANEIEGEETLDLHMAEERGMKLLANLDLDEETRFSSVFRSGDDSGYNDSEDLLFGTQNYLTFVDEGSTTVGQSYAESTIWNSNDRVHPSTSSPMVAVLHSQPSTYIESQEPCFADYVKPFLAGQSSTRTSPFPDCRAHVIPFVEHIASKYSENGMENHLLSKEIGSKTEGCESSLWCKSRRSDTSGLSVNAAAYSPLGISLNGQDATSGRLPPGLSPTSSTLNPYAKEFKLNPSAKSFTPFQPAPPSSDNLFYYPAHMTNMPMFGQHQRAFYMQQSYTPPPPEMLYKGRDF